VEDHEPVGSRRGRPASCSPSCAATRRF
jgi:hypothetical protein